MTDVSQVRPLSIAERAGILERTAETIRAIVEAPRMTIGSFSYHPLTLDVFWKDLEVILTKNERTAAILMASGSPSTITFRQFMDTLHYPGFHGETATIRTLMKRLRRRFEGVDPNFNAIEVINGVGYKWRE